MAEKQKELEQLCRDLKAELEAELEAIIDHKPSRYADQRSYDYQLGYNACRRNLASIARVARLMLAEIEVEERTPSYDALLELVESVAVGSESSSAFASLRDSARELVGIPEE